MTKKPSTGGSTFLTVYGHISEDMCPFHDYFNGECIVII